MTVTIIGAGLAGCEAAWQVATAGISVTLIEMRPIVMTKAHKTGLCAELVCSNSLRGAALSNAVGLLKEELRRCGSLIIQAADATRVPAGGALAVDREAFSSWINDRIHNHPKISFLTQECTSIPPSSRTNPVLIATGPLTSASMAKAIAAITGTEQLAFFDAISPIISTDSIDLTQVFRQSRYDKGDSADYLNVPLGREQYYCFIEQVAQAEKYGGHAEVESDLIEHLRPFEGCMPIEEMIARGPETLLFGPFKPKGLQDPNTGREPFAVLQLRQDDSAGQLWNMVGMQTRMKRQEQERIFRTLPGLGQAEFYRFGSVHRNTFINSPQALASTLELRTTPGLFFAGQLTGVEGYVESTAGGLLAGFNMINAVQGWDLITFPIATAIGALHHYISTPDRHDFQPMNINFGLIPTLANQPKRLAGKRVSKEQRRLAASKQSLDALGQFINSHSLITTQN